jgi:hypothetical protein
MEALRGRAQKDGARFTEGTSLQLKVDVGWSASFRFGLAIATLLVAASGGALSDPKPSSLDVQLEPIVVHARRLTAFDRRAPEKVRFGKLTWRGGLVLTSPSSNFGGWSGIALDAEGNSFLAISDAGTWMTGHLAYDDGKPQGMTEVRLGPLQSLSGETLSSTRNSDAEGLTLQDGALSHGHVLISFERNHRIGRFAIDDGVLSAEKSSLPLPSAIKSLPSNSGLEAIAVLRGGSYSGSIVAFAERLRDKSGDNTGWLWAGGKPQQFHLTDAGEYDVTDAAALPDGSLLVLERRFRWSEGVKGRLRLIRRTELHPGARIEGETLLEADMNAEIDNMEGLAVHTNAAGEIIVTMISDDNFNKGLQRTLLLQFALDGVDLASTGPQH